MTHFGEQPCPRQGGEGKAQIMHVGVLSVLPKAEEKGGESDISENEMDP